MKRHDKRREKAAMTEDIWHKFTVIVEMKDGSFEEVRVEVNSSMSGEVRIHDHGIGKNSVKRIVGNRPGWPSSKDMN